MINGVGGAGDVGVVGGVGVRRAASNANYLSDSLILLSTT